MRHTTIIALGLALAIDSAARPVAAEAAPVNSGPAATDRSSAASLDDARIAAILDQADQDEIAAGRFAAKHTKNPAVRKLAAKMVRDHGKNDKSEKAVLRSAKIQPAASDSSRALESNDAQMMDHLKTLEGAVFDRAYVNSEVTGHRELLDKIDQQILHEVKDPQLKAFIERTRPVIEEHLDRFKAMQSSLPAQ